MFEQLVENLIWREKNRNISKFLSTVILASVGLDLSFTKLFWLHNVVFCFKAFHKLTQTCDYADKVVEIKGEKKIWFLSSRNVFFVKSIIKEQTARR